MSDHSDRLVAALAANYRIEREIARGGMATVYLAEDLRHQRQVAVKVAEVQLGADLVIGTPSMLFRGPYEIEPGPSGSLGYDVAPDGQRFLMVRSEPPRQINVVLNWFEELRGND